jgi:hypothetical protein
VSNDTGRACHWGFAGFRWSCSFGAGIIQAISNCVWHVCCRFEICRKA